LFTFWLLPSITFGENTNWLFGTGITKKLELLEIIFLEKVEILKIIDSTAY